MAVAAAEADVLDVELPVCLDLVRRQHGIRRPRASLGERARPVAVEIGRLLRGGAMLAQLGQREVEERRH